MDGIIFKSTQSDEGDNVVLFHKASRVKSMDLPAGVKISACTKNCDSDGWYPDYNVWETVPMPEEETAPPESELFSEIAILDHDRCDEGSRMETLEVIPTTVEVHHVKRVSVECETHKVERSRRQMRKIKGF